MLNKKKKIQKILVQTALVFSLLSSSIFSFATQGQPINNSKPVQTVTDSQLMSIISSGKNCLESKQISVNSNSVTPRSSVGSGTVDMTEATIRLDVDSLNDSKTIKVTINRSMGTRSLNEFSAELRILDIDGKRLSSQMITYSPNFTYKEFTFNIPMLSVNESVFLVSPKVDINFTFWDSTLYFNTLMGMRYMQYGGPISNISAMGGQRHHCFASSVYSNTPVYRFSPSKSAILSTKEAPVILMTATDHYKTASYGGNINYRTDQLNLVRQGKYIQAMQKDIDDIKFLFPGKYDKALKDMYNYAYNTLGWR